MTERKLIRRDFASTLEIRDVDDRTHEAYGRVVPYGEVIDFHEDGQHKRERFPYGAMAGAAKAWHRVVLYYGHDQRNITNRLGYGVALEERQDGAWSRFRLDRGIYERALDVLTSTHKGLSLGYYSLRDRLAYDGVIDRLSVYVDHVAAVEEPAYSGATLMYARDAASAGGDVDTTEARILEQEAAERASGGSRTPRLDALRADLARLEASPAERAVRASLGESR